MSVTYQKLIDLLNQNELQYRIIDHPGEGQTDLVSAIRGHSVDQAAKCIILIVKRGKKDTSFLLAVVRGNARVNTSRIKEMYRATYVGFASSDVAERLAGSPTGTVLPFSFTPELAVIADRSIMDIGEFYFNAARLDRSIAMRTADYAALAKPRFDDISLV